MKFKPMYDRLLVKADAAPEFSKGGIKLPDIAKEKPTIGTITAAGIGYRDDNGSITPLIVKVGDRILYGKWSGTEIEVDNIKYLMIKESDIMAVLNENLQ